MSMGPIHNRDVTGEPQTAQAGPRRANESHTVDPSGEDRRDKRQAPDDQHAWQQAQDETLNAEPSTFDELA